MIPKPTSSQYQLLLDSWSSKTMSNLDANEDELGLAEEDHEEHVVDAATLVGDEDDEEQEAVEDTGPRSHPPNIFLSPERPCPQEGSAHATDHEEPANPIEEENWRRRKKHVFILSSAGKPVFSRYGDESDFSELFGILQVLISMAQSNGSGENLRRVTAGPDFVIHFHTVGELSYVMVTRTEESTKSCVRQLRLMHLQMLSVLPTVNAVLTKSPGYDVRRMFSSVDAAAMRQLIKRMSWDPTFVFRCASVVPMAVDLRREVERSIIDSRTHEANPEDHLYSLLLFQSSLVGSVAPKDQPLHIDDYLLLLNFVATACTSQQGEIWAPICLPKFNDTGYLWCYCTKLTANSDLTLVQLATAQDAFAALSRRSVILQEALAPRFSELITACISNKALSWKSLSAWSPSPCLQWFVGCSDAKQMVATAQPPPLAHSKSTMKFTLRLFARLRDKLTILSRAAHPVLIHSTEEQSYVIVKTKALEGLGLFLPCTPRKVMVDTIVKALKAIVAKESAVLLVKAAIWGS